jgi:hypothetical protein
MPVNGRQMASQVRGYEEPAIPGIYRARFFRAAFTSRTRKGAHLAAALRAVRFRQRVNAHSFPFDVFVQ